MTPESAGSNCANGGTRIDVGVDDNSNGVLEASEIDQTQYVCDGGSSNNTMLTSISSPPASMGCDAGGRVIAHGLDNGDGGGTYANGVLETGEIDSSTTFCSRFAIGIVKDIYSGSSTSIYPYWLTAVGNTLYFGANDGTYGDELWMSDGTASGTVMVKDIYSGSGSSSPDYSQPLATPSISSQRRNQRRRIVEERRNCLRHGDGQGYLRAEAAAVLPTTSQPLATPSISEPTTEPTDTNCGRAMELPQAR